MPFVFYQRGKPKVSAKPQISKMSWDELITYEKFLWECMEKLPLSPTISAALNAVHREVEWRAQDTEFEQGR